MISVPLGNKENTSYQQTNIHYCMDFCIFHKPTFTLLFEISLPFFTITSCPYYTSKSAACPSFLPLTTDINDCNGSCLNGGSCIDGIKSFTCTCLAGYTGRLCETGRVMSSLDAS